MAHTRRPTIDPFVAFFLRSDPEPLQLMQAIRAAPHPPTTAKGQAIITLLEIVLGRRPEADLQGVEAAYHERSSVDLHVLFLFTWWRALLLVEPDWPRIRLLRDRIVSLVNENTPPEIVGWVQLVQASTLFFAGDAAGRLRVIDKLVEGVPASSPHYLRLETFRHLAYLEHGMGAALKPSLDTDAIGPIFQQRLKVMQLVNSAMIGAVDGAAVPGQVRTRDSDWFRSTGSYHVAVAALQLMAEQRGVPIRSLEPALASLGDREPAWVRSTRALLAHRPEEALEHARVLVNQEPPTHRSVIGFDEYTLIRAELAVGHGEAAKRLLLQRQAKGSSHFIDDLFLARAELLARNHDLAARHLARLLEAVDQYGARGRLDFEMHLACEVAPSELIHAARQAGRSLERAGEVGEARAAPRPSQQAESVRGLERVVHGSRAMSAVCEQVLRFSDHDAPVLVTGETGTGKELIAQALHETGPDADAPFIAINCSALSDTLVESELFGHARGAFTGANVAHPGLFREAGAGTILLDEIGDISPKLQRALLRVLETDEVRPVGSSRKYKIACRIIAATNAHLEARVDEGAFRQDLLFRLQRLQIHIPPLRERTEDIARLAEHFFNAGRPQGQRVALSVPLRERLETYPWPGNVRQLRNVVERMRVLESDKLSYDVDDFEPALTRLRQRGAAQPTVELPAQGPDDQPSEAEALSRDAVSPPPRRPLDQEEHIDAYLTRRNSPRRRQQRLRELFERHGELKTVEAARILGVSPDTATRDLKQLAAQGVIEKIEPTRSPRTHYYLLRRLGPRSGS